MIGSDRLSSTRSKAACTSAMIGPWRLGIDRAGQRHVKAKILEHERVTPAVEVFDLASARARANAPVPLLRRQRTAKSVEHRHAIRRELVHGGACPPGNDGNEPFDRTDSGLDRYRRTRQSAESIEFRHQIRFGERRQQTKGRLQCGVKSVSARLARKFFPGNGGEPDIGGMAEVVAAIAIIAEKAGTEAIEIGAGWRHEVDRVSRLVHHSAAAATPNLRLPDVAIISACARCTTRPDTIVATTRGRSGADGSTMTRSARWPRAMSPRSVNRTA